MLSYPRWRRSGGESASKGSSSSMEDHPLCPPAHLPPRRTCSFVDVFFFLDIVPVLSRLPSLTRFPTKKPHAITTGPSTFSTPRTPNGNRWNGMCRVFVRSFILPSPLVAPMPPEPTWGPERGGQQYVLTCFFWVYRMHTQERAETNLRRFLSEMHVHRGATLHHSHHKRKPRK